MIINLLEIGLHSRIDGQLERPISSKGVNSLPPRQQRFKLAYTCLYSMSVFRREDAVGKSVIMSDGKLFGTVKDLGFRTDGTVAFIVSRPDGSEDAISVSATSGISDFIVLKPDYQRATGQPTTAPAVGAPPNMPATQNPPTLAQTSGTVSQVTSSSCPRCGKPIRAGAKFCPSCGAKLI